MIQDVRVTLVGHPFAPHGMGEHLRGAFRALRSAGVDAHVRDVYGMYGPTSYESASDLRPHLVARLDSDVAIFVLNGDEREKAFQKLGNEINGAGYRIVYPAWELARYPDCWARELEHYDEVWAASRFSMDAFAKNVHVPVHHLPLPCHPILTRQLSRRYFEISETSYTFVFFFDLTSFIERKNPFSLLSAFAKLRNARPFADVQLVIKANNKHADPAAFSRFCAAVEPFGRHARIIDRVLTHNEVKSLVTVGDAFVSMHRSEGFGFGLAEAMYFGKPVVATAYSGNVDYMTPDTTHLVPYTPVPVREGQYPHGVGQVWAEPDVDVAAARMIELVDDPARGRELGARASAHVRTHYSLRATGMRYAARLEQIGRAGVGAAVAQVARMSERAPTVA